MFEILKKQIDFIKEIDQLKLILRRSPVCGGERRENSAEHSWHLAMLAITIAEHANEPIDVLRVVKMVLIHDIVEIDAGDTFVYDTKGYEDKEEREQKAADRLFGLLPDKQTNEFMNLWHEFETRESADAKFANALDRTMPLLHNYMAEGGSWKTHNVNRAMVDSLSSRITDGSESLSQFIGDLVDDAVEKGYLGA
ncbi:MAG: putative hydrolase of HD superfamily [Cellvibrionaceae bacterium]